MSRLLIPAVYVSHERDLRRWLRLSRVNDVLRIEWRWPWQ